MAEPEKYDVIVVGSGPGGYVAALKTAELGMRVACVEKESRVGGVCLNVGCIPSKALLDSSEWYHLARERFSEHGIRTGRVGLDLAAMMQRKETVVRELTENVRQLLERSKIDLIHGQGRLAGSDRLEIRGAERESRRSLSAEAIVLATGSQALSVPGIEFDGRHIVSSTEALSFDAVPKHLVVIGGGYIGLELGSVWLRLGAEVSVIEMLPNIVANLDGQVGRRLQRLLKRQGFAFHLQTEVARVEITGKKNRRLKLELQKGGRSESLSCDRLLVSAGRRPRTEGLGLEEAGIETDEHGRVRVDARFRTSVPSIYAIGDLIPGPMLAHKASAEGVAVAQCIAGRPGEVNYDAIPGVVYTWPEVASVGLTEEQVKERGIAYRSGTFPFTGNGRARCMGDTEGFVKVIAQEKSDRVLGVHIIGPRASDLIAECVLAVEMGAASEDIARTIHAHPTLSETLQEAAWAALR
jgi:dihydrolipoamide dehydrogenase